MKLNKLLSIIISSVIAFTASFTFHSSFEDTISFTAAAAVDENAVYDSWQEGYRTILDDFQCSSLFSSQEESGKATCSTYAIHDMNGDGIPELYINYQPISASASVLYTFYDSKVIKLGIFPKGGDISYCEDDGIIESSGSGGAGGWGYTNYFRIVDDKIEDIDSFSVSWGTTPNSYTRNGNTISESEYNKYINQYKTKNWIEVGRENYFEDLYCRVGDIYYQYFFDYYMAWFVSTESKASSLTIPQTVNGVPVTSISGMFLINNSTLKTINLPSSINNFNYYAFCEGHELTTINIDAANPYFTSKDGIMYNKDMTKIIKFPTAKNVSAFSFPQSVTSIGRYAFAWCTGVKTITIPENIDSIYDHAFYLCPNLSSVTVENVCCDFWDNWDDYKGYTICNTYDKTSDSYNYLGVIRGYDYSYAQDYAEYFGRTFISLGSASTTTTKTTTTSTTISTTTTTTTSSTPIESVKLGDVNDDNKITPVDASLTLLTYAKKQTQSDSNAGFEGLTSSQIAAADVNKDNRITPVDASLILGYYSHLQTDNNFGNYMTMEEYLNHS